MIGEGLPTECRDCGEDVVDVFDHADGCDVADRIARNEIARIEEVLGTVWEVDGHREQLEQLRDLVGGGVEA